MQPVLDTVNDVQELTAAGVVSINRAGTDATTTTVELSADVLRRLSPEGPAVPFGPGLFRFVTRSVDAGFAMAAGVLEVQRDLATRVLDAIEPLFTGEPMPEPTSGGSGSKSKSSSKAA